ncbi:hypothetical protein [Ramlibacter sp. AN1133]|uniref:hypothetical protein n=1 Tax=Ramlibacter sp. AN1133 TaxID=3133429 RepID=UPI0030C3437C
MERRDRPPRDWPQPPAGDPAPSYAPETLLLAGIPPGEGDEQVRTVVLGLPDGAGPLRRVGVCNAAGEVYREVTLHGPLQLLYFWAGLNALGFRQQAAEERAISKYTLVFARDPAERRPLGAAVK